ncbi:DegT/DnrJ/EryC1/StrS family aminotransferase [Streptomyces sp. NPDC060048]|uniref:DegT/DnrJ/EryC1/StrS family aminotransferase n=1 Tax=Streptomyces sp. NPDC060048 TaxID=3347045 RepID=UPI00367AFA90
MTTGTDPGSPNVSQGAAVKSVEVSAEAEAEAEAGGREREGVPFFTQAATFDALWPSISAHIQDVFDRNKWSHGRKCLELERAVAAYTGAKHAIAVNNGTDALVILLRAAGVRRGDEVVVPAFTFAATATTVAAIGAVPVFADIDPVTYAMDPVSFEKAITERTRAVMPAHLFTQLADMDAISEVAERHGITVLEDSAEGIGMRWNGKHAGLLGRGGVLSFFPTKTLGAIGDAGMILTDDDEIAETAQILRHHGRMGKTIDHIAGISNLSGASGTNSKMDDIQAAVLMAKLPRLDQDIATRARLARAYHERLSGLPGILRLPTVVERPVPTDAVFYVYEIEVERRDELVAHLTSRGIGTETYYPIPLHVQPCFADLGYEPGDFPVAEAACERAVALPFYPDLTEEQLDTVVAAIRDFFTGSQS